jgi:hypothetical protein
VNLLQRLSGRYGRSVEPLRSERRLELLVLALLLMLLLQAVILAWTGLAGGRVVPVRPAADSMRVATPVSPGSIAATDSARVQSRPLFWPSRRPVPGESTADPSPAQQAAESAPRLKGLSVTGVFGAGSEGGVIVSYKGREARLLTGEALDGWVLESVAAGEAVFANAGGRDVRRLLPQPALWEGSEETPSRDTGSSPEATNKPSRVNASPAPTSIARPPRARARADQ